MNQTIDLATIGNIKVSVLKDENNGEIGVVLTPQTNNGVIPILDIKHVILLSATLLEIADLYYGKRE